MATKAELTTESASAATEHTEETPSESVSESPVLSDALMPSSSMASSSMASSSMAASAVAEEPRPPPDSPERRELNTVPRWNCDVYSHFPTARDLVERVHDDDVFQYWIDQIVEARMEFKKEAKLMDGRINRVLNRKGTERKGKGLAKGEGKANGEGKQSRSSASSDASSHETHVTFSSSA